MEIILLEEILILMVMVKDNIYYNNIYKYIQINIMEYINNNDITELNLFNVQERKLVIESCDNLEQIIIKNSPNLKEIEIKSNFRLGLVMLENLPGLESIILHNCDEIIFHRSIYANLNVMEFEEVDLYDFSLDDRFINLQECIFKYCSFDETLPITIDLIHLELLIIVNCTIRYLALNHRLPRLKGLVLGHNNLESFHSLYVLSSLYKLYLTGNDLNKASFPVNEMMLENLKHLHVDRETRYPIDIYNILNEYPDQYELIIYCGDEVCSIDDLSYY